MSKRSSRSKKSSTSKQGSMKEQKTQSGSKRGSTRNNNNSSKSKQKSLLAPTQHSQKSLQKTQVTQKSIAPPDEDKFDALKKEAFNVRRSQITQITATKSMQKRETGYDKTQWELTRWAEEAAKPTDIAPPKPNEAPLGLAPPKEVLASEVPGENRQEDGEKGDFLLDIPTTSLILNGIELALILLTIILSNIASAFQIVGIYFTTVNLLLCFGGTGFICFWQFRHYDVAEEESKQGIKLYYVRGCSKQMYFHLHYWRTILYFLSFVICLYHGVCGEERAGFRYEGYCREGASMGLLIASSVFCIFCMIPPIIHLVFIKRNTFAIVSFCRDN